MLRRTRLRQARKAKFLSQEALAAKVGASLPAVQAWERGTVVPRLKFQEALQHVLGVKIEELLAIEAIAEVA